MKLLFTIWISAVLTQEVFSSALVRYPRHAVSKPTSSVHTEYEATYEQKGKHGNGSFSTVSGKQEVVHDNCHDNWNAFADKCASLIKDLVASLGNAVSSKPGDATNLQLRIRNTFKHFDSTDNCTCFTKNSLTSLFDNVTSSAAEPVAVHEEVIPSAQNGNGNGGQVQSTTCEGGSCNLESGGGQKVLSSSQQRGGQPSLTLTNADDVDLENADTSKESSNTNSRRGVQYPAVIVKDPSQRSIGSGTAVNQPKQSSPASGSSSNTKKILPPGARTSQPAPAEIVVPTIQSQGSTKPVRPTTSSRTSAPQQSSSQSVSPVYPPAKNNGIVRSAIPVGPSSSASKISPPEAAAIRFPSDSSDAGSGSGQATGALSDTKTPLEVSVEPGEEVVPVNREETATGSNAASDQIPVIAPVVLTEPVKSAAAKPQSDSSVSSAANGASGQIPSEVSETISIKSEGNKDEDCDEEQGSEGSESVLTPVAPVVEPVSGTAAKPVSVPVAEPENISIKNEGDKEEDCDEEKDSEGSESVPVAEPENISIKSEGGEEEKGSDGSESDQIPIATPLASASGAEPQISSSPIADSVQTAAPVASITKPVNGAAAVPEIASNTGSPAINNGGSGQSGTVPETISIKNEGNKEEDCDEEKGSEGSESVPVVPVVEPVTGTGEESVNVPVAEPETVSIKSEGDKEEDLNQEKGSEGSESVLAPVVPVAKPVATVADPISETAAESVSVPVAEPETIPIKSEGNKEEDLNQEKGSEGSESVPAVPVVEPVTGTGEESVSVPVVEPETIKNEGDKEEDCDEEKGSEGSESVPVAEPENISVKNEGDKEEDCDEEKGSEGSESVPVAEPETISIKNEGNKEEDLNQEKGSEGSESVPVVPVVEPVTGTGEESVNVPVAEPETVSIKSEGDKEEDCDEEKGSESEKIPIVPPVIPAAEPQVTSTDAGEDSDGEGAAGNGSNQRPVVKPVTSTFQDPSTVVSKGNTNSASNSKSSVVPAIPVSDSGDSEIPVITQDSTYQEPLSISDDPTLPEIASASDTANVKPGLVVKQPKSQHPAQKNPSVKVPLINSNSNLPDSTGPVDSAGTVNPSPIYQSLPTAPSAPPSSDSAVVSKKPQQTTNKQEVSQPLANERDKTAQSGADRSISSVKGISVAPMSASQRSQGKGGKETDEKVFIVTPVPVYPEKVIVKPAEAIEGGSKHGSPSKGSELATTKSGGALVPAVETSQADIGRQENLLTTPIPVIPVVAKEQNGDAAGQSASGKPSIQQHPLFTNLGNKKPAGKQITAEPVVLRPPSPPKVVKVPAVQTAEDEDPTKGTTFQTTSTDPTPPQQSLQSPPLKHSVSLTRPTSLPQDSFETPHGAPSTSPRTPHDDDDDDEEEDCCSCESCTEEEVTNPKQYKEMACKDLEEARKELKAIFDKIKKRLKCGKKAPQKIAAS